MRSALLTVTAVLFTLSVTGDAQVIDDFSHQGWRRFSTTPGTLSTRPGKLHLADAPGDPDYVTASKTFAVDVDKTPLFLVHVGTLSDRGTVKLIRKEPYDKRVALQLDRPGLYLVDMRKQFAWTGRNEIQVCLYAIGDRAEIDYDFVEFAAKLTEKDKQALLKRITSGNVKLSTAPFEVVPLFNACSVYYKSPPVDGLSTSYRKRGGQWQPAFPLVYVNEDGMYRGSIVNLEENTLYEVRLTDAGGKVLAHTRFRTWRSDVPVARTIVLDADNFTGRYVVKDSGTPDGWVKITARKGFVLRNDRTGPLLELDGVKNVLVEGLTLRGGLRNIITIKRCRNVRVVNCDLAGWGRTGIQRFDRDGKYYTKSGNPVNWDCAILLSRTEGTVIERCYIHDPVNKANSWYYSHPAGPEAVGVDRPESTVLRYNDFIGSDEHRWNDAVEGAGNFHIDGGFNRDADIYGNLMCYANDDAIEIDGGQTNVRVFQNKFEGCLCGVSIQGCMSGPSYVFGNLLVNMGDERGLAGQTIKTSSHANGPHAVSFIFNNTCFGDSRDLNLPYNLRIVAKNNLFAGVDAISGRSRSRQSECDYNLLVAGRPGEEKHGVVAEPGFVDPDKGLFSLQRTSPAIGRGIALPNFAPSTTGHVDIGALPFAANLVLPVRPVPVLLDRYQVVFSSADVDPRHPATVTATVSQKGFAQRFRIAKNDVFDWFTVTPAAGILQAGKPVLFTVTVDATKTTRRQLYKGAFLVRLENGYSRPVMVYARTSYTPPLKPRQGDAWVTYLEAESGTGGKPYEVVSDSSASGGKYVRLSGPGKKNPVEYRFRTPRPGKYFVVLRVRAEEPVHAHDSLYFGIDNGPFDRSRLRVATKWNWSLAAHNRQMSLICLQPLDLTAGDHVLRLAPQESLQVDLIAVTDNPKPFE